MNTSFDHFRVNISGNIQYSATNHINWYQRLEPGQKYEVIIETVSWKDYDYEMLSTPHHEEITTMRKSENAGLLNSNIFYTITCMTVYSDILQSLHARKITSTCNRIMLSCDLFMSSSNVI